MNKKLAILAIHGMGETPPTFADEISQQLKFMLGQNRWNQIYFNKIYYQGIIQGNQKNIWDAMRAVGLRWKPLREKMMYAFSDPATIEHGASSPDSIYLHVQRVITKALRDARAALVDADAPIVIIAQSLGGHVISNYIWDAQAQAKGKKVIGVWRDDINSLLNSGSQQEIDFMRLRTLRFIFTTGCNIPLFVAGQNAIVAIDKPDPIRDFDWLNFYDRDDVLGWPLKPLSPSYDLTVTEDINIEVGPIATGATPLSHLYYWQDGQFLGTVETLMRNLL